MLCLLAFLLRLEGRLEDSPFIDEPALDPDEGSFEEDATASSG